MPHEAQFVMPHWDKGRYISDGCLLSEGAAKARVFMDAHARKHGEVFTWCGGDEKHGSPWDLARGIECSFRTAQRYIKELEQKHSIVAFQRGSRRKVVYRLLTYPETLRLCADDPNYGRRIVDGVPHFFTWARGRRIMSEQEIGPEGWRADDYIAAKYAAAPTAGQEIAGKSQGAAAEAAPAPASEAEILEAFAPVKAEGLIEDEGLRTIYAEASKIAGKLTASDISKMLAAIIAGRSSRVPMTFGYLRAAMVQKANALKEIRAQRTGEAKRETEELLDLAVKCWRVVLDHGAHKAERDEAIATLKTYDAKYGDIRDRAKTIAQQQLYGQKKE